MKFEYKVLQASGVLDETEWLNQQGAREWELIQILVYGDYPETNSPQFDYYFKRRIEINPKLRVVQLKEVPNNDNESSTATGGIPEEGL